MHGAVRLALRTVHSHGQGRVGLVYHRIIRNESVEGTFIEPNTEQARQISAYIERYRASLGVAPVGLHWLPELEDFVFLPPAEGIPERQ